MFAYTPSSATVAPVTTIRRRRRRAPIAVALATAVLCGAGPEVAAAAPPPPVSYQEYVVQVCKNTLNENVYFRRGWWFTDQPNAGFGFDKIYHKHNIRVRDRICRTVREPTKVEPAGGPGGWAHERIFGEFDCRRGRPGCALVRSVVIRVIINYHGWFGPGQQGIVTAYCKYLDKRPRCDEWINHPGVR